MEVLHYKLQMFSVGSVHPAEPLHFLHTAQVLPELLESSEWHKCPLPRALTSVSSAPGEPLPQFSWTEMPLPTLEEHQGSPVWVQMERFYPRRFLSTGKAQKDRNVHQLLTCWTLTDVCTNRFCGIQLPRSKLQCQLCWCKPGQTPEEWKSLHLHQDKWKQQCATGRTPFPSAPVLHTWLSTTMPRDHQCTLEEEKEEVAATSWRSIT